jgi:hypothetical protein
MFVHEAEIFDALKIQVLADLIENFRGDPIPRQSGRGLFGLGRLGSMVHPESQVFSAFAIETVIDLVDDI